jgi:hypothetical protein
VFEELDFLYCPSRDVAGDLAHYVERLGGNVVWAIERFGTRVARIELAPGRPHVLLAEHLEGDQPVLMFRVSDLEAAEAELASRGATVSERFGFPDGEGVEVETPGPQRVGIYERTRPERGASLEGRIDF